MENTESQYDLALAWTWKYDHDFVRLMKETAAERSLRFLEIESSRVAEVLELVRKRAMHIGCFIDRASDEDEAFIPLVRLLHRRKSEPDQPTRPVCIINAPDLMARAADKATMHLEFLSHNINVPYTIIISPYNHRKEIELGLSELAHLGRPFIIKPANTTGGGVGVVTGAESLKEVLEARQHHRNDKYLLQETIDPVTLGDHRAWFRVFCLFGTAIPCWWDDRSHVYQILSGEDEARFGLHELGSMTRRIHEVCRLDFFSTEIAMTSGKKLVAVDYANELCDMRLQSKHGDGVPDAIVRQIVERIVQFAKQTTDDERGCHGSPSLP